MKVDYNFIVLFTKYFFEQENNNNIMDSIDFASDSDSLLDTYYYGCLSSDESSDDVSQLIPTNNNVPVTIINQVIYFNHY